MRNQRHTPGLTLVEALILLVLVAGIVWLLLPARDRGLRHGRRAACMEKLAELHKGLLAYLDAGDGYFPPAWHVAGTAIADDLGNLTYSRFALHEQCDPGFHHVVTARDVEENVGLLPARQQKYRLTAHFWKCPAKGWTDDYFAPETLFRMGDGPVRRAALDREAPPNLRPVFADVNASFPDPDAEHLQDPGHDHELRSGFSTIEDSGTDVYLGVGSSLRVEGHLPSCRLDFRHGGAANALFLDGHVDPVASDDAARLKRLHDTWNRAAAEPEEK